MYPLAVTDGNYLVLRVQAIHPFFLSYSITSRNVTLMLHLLKGNSEGLMGCNQAIWAMPTVAFQTCLVNFGDSVIISVVSQGLNKPLLISHNLHNSRIMWMLLMAISISFWTSELQVTSAISTYYIPMVIDHVLTLKLNGDSNHSETACSWYLVDQETENVKARGGEHCSSPTCGDLPIIWRTLANNTQIVHQDQPTVIQFRSFLWIFPIEIMTNLGHSVGPSMLQLQYSHHCNYHRLARMFHIHTSSTHKKRSRTVDAWLLTLACKPTTFSYK